MSLIPGFPQLPKGQTDASRFTPLTVMVMFVSILAFLGVAIWAILKYRASESTPLIVTVVGFAVLLVGYLFGVKIVQDNTAAVQQHTVTAATAVTKLTAIEDKVNGGTERALNALREQHRIEMHDKNNEVGNAKLALEIARADFTRVSEECAGLKGQLKTCEEERQRRESKNV